jgi:hypothetical protein
MLLFFLRRIVDFLVKYSMVLISLFLFLLFFAPCFLQYTFDGYLHIIFISQDFDILNTGMVITGKQILDQVYNNKDVNAWGMIGVLIAYIIFFRLAHYGLFLYASLPFLTTAAPSDSTVVAAPVKNAKSGAESDIELGKYAVVPKN